jgi:DNA-binding response OmpR family regulator
MQTMSLRMEMHGYDEATVAALSGASSPQPRLILAEDDTDTRNLLASLLRREGYEVQEAADGIDLLDRLETAAADGLPADAIVADIKMPGLDGFDVLEELGCEHWQTPFILITANGTREAYAKARRLGAAAVLTKPFPINQLNAVVRAALHAE